MSNDGPLPRPHSPDDVIAYTAIVREHRARLVALVRSIIPDGDYESAASEALLTLFRHWPTITADRVAWVTTVAKHNALTQRRRQREHAATADDDDIPLWSTAPASADQRLDLQNALELLPRLPKQEQIALVLSAAGQDTAAIAAQLGVKADTVRKYRARAQRRMRTWGGYPHPTPPSPGQGNEA
ncbi:RNA polymerase sigma factor [Amycolatopsis sp. WAC 04169]|uniref:RNA polymerase sigma factor n=1 Tax=Amycolatopsis sp. WAC 04169 TaxID=2203197 RepID=UPI0013153A04|nr:sigma-70 family RNA polymerase sigma factor [Amycolatopsis sp. WAC 04169]